MGLIHLDAGVVMGFFDARDPHHDASRAVLDRAREARDAVELGASALAECMVGPARAGRQTLRAARAALDQLAIRIVELDAESAIMAAQLRADHRSLKLPDALVIAMAVVHGADLLVTTDRRWPDNQTLALPLTIDVI